MTAIDPEMTKPEPKRKPKPDTGLCSTHTGGPHPMEPACKDWRAAQLGEKAAPSAKLPIDRPCSACGDGDTEMKYHDHEPPFREWCRVAASEQGARTMSTEQERAEFGEWLIWQTAWKAGREFQREEDAKIAEGYYTASGERYYTTTASGERHGNRLAGSIRGATKP